MNKEEWISLRDSYWHGVVEMLDVYIDFELIKLRTCKPHELQAVQESIKQLDRLKNLPKDVLEADNFGEDYPASAQRAVKPLLKKGESK